MTLKQHYKAALKELAKEINPLEYELALDTIGVMRCGIDFASPKIYDTIREVMDEYGYDNDLPEDWWEKFGDEDDVFWDIEL